ncbi:MAG: hypothetical protein CMM76_04275 [Rhodospirillaceae bacterium]|nr:hypothetical protein [Rhodospirillaceae bacterium]
MDYSLKRTFAVPSVPVASPFGAAANIAPIIQCKNSLNLSTLLSKEPYSSLASNQVELKKVARRRDLDGVPFFPTLKPDELL